MSDRTDLGVYHDRGRAAYIHNLKIRVGHARFSFNLQSLKALFFCSLFLPEVPTIITYAVPGHSWTLSFNLRSSKHTSSPAHQTRCQALGLQRCAQSPARMQAPKQWCLWWGAGCHSRLSEGLWGAETWHPCWRRSERARETMLWNAKEEQVFISGIGQTSTPTNIHSSVRQALLSSRQLWVGAYYPCFTVKKQEVKRC